MKEKELNINIIDQKEKFTVDVTKTSVENTSETVCEAGCGSDTSSFE